MMIFKKAFPITTLFLAALLMFASCEKDDINIDSDDTNREQVTNERGFLGLVSTETTTETDSTYTDCFSINFPIGIDFPDGTTQAVNSEEELFTVVELWFENNQEAEEFPTLVFPVTVTLADGTTQSVNNDEELCDLFHECYGDDEWEDDDYNEDDEFMTDCFTPVFPFNVTTANGITSIGSEAELEVLLETLDEDDLFELAFPVTVLLEEDGTTLTINNEEELEELLIECYGDDEWDDDDYEHEGGEFMAECFTPVFPINVTTATGTIGIGSEAELEALLETLGEDDIFELTFPLTVLIEEDGSMQTINNEEELEDLLIDCYGDEEWEDCDDMDDFEDCFTIVFPFSVSDGTTTTTINDEAGLEAYFEVQDEDADFELVYPVNLLLADGTTVSVNSDDEIEEILEDCE